MKKLFCAMAILSMCLAVSVRGDPIHPENADAKEEKEVSFQKQTPCPITTMISDCLKCHQAPSFRIIKKEVDPNEKYNFPHPWATRIMGKTLYYRIESVDADKIFDLFEYFKLHPELEDIVFELFSPGGSMMHALRILGYMDEMKASGVKITTKTYGFCASAGFLIAVNGSIRLASPTSVWMWHEITSFKMFDVSTPSDKENEAETLRFFQDNGNGWLAKKSKMTKEEIDAEIKHKDFWMNGADAVKYGFADKLIK